MKRILLFIILMSLAGYSHAQADYITLEYKGTEFKQQSDLLDFLTKKDSNLAVILTGYVRSGIGDETIVIPPTKLDVYSQVNNTVIADDHRNILLKSNIPITSSQKLHLAVRYVAIGKTEADTLVKGLGNIASVYTSADPRVSALAEPIMKTMFSLMEKSADSRVSITEGIESNKSRTVQFYLNNKGHTKTFMDNEAKYGLSGSYALVTLSIKHKKALPLDFDGTWAQQPGRDTTSNRIFSELANLGKGLHYEKHQVCEKLKAHLEQAHGKETGVKMTAIAIDTIGWGQDDTNFKCISLEEAKKIQKLYPSLSKLVGCRHDKCFKTKQALIEFKDHNTDYAKEILGLSENEELKIKGSCNVKPWDLTSWESIGVDRDEKNTNTRRSYKSTLTINDRSYIFTFNWKGDKVDSVACRGV